MYWFFFHNNAMAKVRKAIHKSANGGEGSSVRKWSEGDEGGLSVTDGVHRMEGGLVTLAS